MLTDWWLLILTLFVRFLIPQQFSIYELQGIIRQKLSLDRNQTLFLLVNGKVLLKNDHRLAKIYQDHQDPDGFLYLTYCKENTLG